MPSNYSTFVVAFRGQVEVSEGGRVPGGDKPSTESMSVDQLVVALNEDVGRLSEEAERELGRMLPPGISARVELTFSTGSLVVAGMLTLFAWAAPIVAKRALETVTERALGLALDRVLRRQLISRRSQLSLRGPLSIQTEFSAVPALEESTLPAESAPTAPVLGPTLGGLGATVLLVVNTVLLMALVVIEALRIARLP